MNNPWLHIKGPTFPPAKIEAPRPLFTGNGFDYSHQAWVIAGRYVACGHTAQCTCYGTLHEGEPCDPTSSIH